MSRRSLLAFVATLCVVGLVVLVSEHIGTSSHPLAGAGTPTTTAPPATTVPPVIVPGGAPVGLVAGIRVTTDAYVSPGGALAARIAATWHGSPLFLPVIARQSGDLEVRLPTRPNGSTAWITDTGIQLYHSPYRIVINLSSRHLLLFKDGVLILDAPAGVGTVTDPTPTGQFFVASFAKAPTPAWGAFVLVTSAHSNAITDWEESGDAVVAIHGPLGEDAEIGTAGAQVSHGCVRLHDNALAQLRVVPDGSPIDIIA